MFELGGDDFPHDNASLADALSQGAERLGVASGAVAIEGSFPSLGALRINLTGAHLERQKRLHRTEEKNAGGFFARVIEITAAPAQFANVPVHLRLRAEDCVLAFSADGEGTRIARLEKCSAGTLEASATIADIEGALLTLAGDAAAVHGAEVQSVRIVAEAETPRSLALTATAVAKAMFFTATLTIHGRVELDAECNARLIGITCTGDGMIANLAASQLRPRLAEWEGRAIPIAPLLPDGQRLLDVSITGGATIAIHATIGTEAQATANERKTGE